MKIPHRNTHHGSHQPPLPSREAMEYWRLVVTALTFIWDVVKTFLK